MMDEFKEDEGRESAYGCYKGGKSHQHHKQIEEDVLLINRLH